MTCQYDFDIDGQLVIGNVTLDGDTTWEMFKTWNEGRCPGCGAEINQHEVVCDECLERANKYRTSGPPIDWR